MNNFWTQPLVWLAVTCLLLGLCTWLPVKVKDDRTRRMVYWFVLVPASLILICYAYPAGMEVFRRMALTF